MQTKSKNIGGIEAEGVQWKARFLADDGSVYRSETFVSFERAKQAVDTGRRVFRVKGAAIEQVGYEVETGEELRKVWHVEGDREVIAMSGYRIGRCYRAL